MSTIISSAPDNTWSVLFFLIYVKILITFNVLVLFYQHTWLHSHLCNRGQTASEFFFWRIIWVFFAGSLTFASFVALSAVLSAVQESSNLSWIGFHTFCLEFKRQSSQQAVSFDKCLVCVVHRMVNLSGSFGCKWRFTLHFFPWIVYRSWGLIVISHRSHLNLHDLF